MAPWLCGDPDAVAGATHSPLLLSQFDEPSPSSHIHVVWQGGYPLAQHLRLNVARGRAHTYLGSCLLYTSDAADE